MDRRTHEGPMDFEYSNGTGPIDARSPFAQLSGNQQSFASMGMDNRKRGSQTAFGSPSKPGQGTLRPALPPSPSKSMSSFKNNPLFSTPRKLDYNENPSSGGETPQSPIHDVTMLDSDATPDTGINFRGVAARFDQATAPSFPANSSPTKLKDKKVERAKEPVKRRDSWWTRAFVSFSPSSNAQHATSGRGEIPHAGKGSHEHKVTKSTAKKRRGDAVKQLMRSRKDSVSDSEDSRPPSPSKSKRRLGLLSRGRKGSDDSAGSADDKARAAASGRAWWWSMAEFLTQHPTLPQILSWYAQLLLNGFLILGLMYILWSFYATIRNDIDRRSAESMGDFLAEMAICAKQFTDNRCAPETRVPAMETVCQNWEKCMRQDPKALGRARISVGMWAEIFNGFVEPISWKTMLFTVIVVFAAVALSNLPFSMIRHRAEQQQAAANHHHYYGNVPPTPGRQFSNPGELAQSGYWTPHHQNQQSYGLEPAPSQGFGPIEGRESPVKRLQFR